MTMVIEKERIIIVTSAESLGQGLERALRDAGYETSVVRDELSAIEALRRHKASLVLLDRQMVKFGRLLQDPQRKDILLMALHKPGLVCADEECAEDLTLGLDASFCDPTYRLVVARVRAMLRANKWQRSVATKVYRVGKISMNVDRHEVTVNGREVKLTFKEFQILRCLLHAPRRAFTRQELLDEIWGEGYALEEHNLDVHVHSLRQKIEKDPHKPQYILTVRGVGYKIAGGN